MKSYVGWTLLGVVLLPLTLTGQSITGVGLSETARAQIDSLRASVLHLGTPAAAREARYRPALGMIPTMGTHWVRRRRMPETVDFDLTRPQQLMFAPIDGVETLVGVAFAYQAQPGEERPEGFDGDLDEWHVHPDLSPPGRELAMLHVWFVPSPDGPFAGHNPWLPYFAAGLEPPDAARLEDETDSYRIRALALALAETVSTPFSLDRVQERLPEWFSIPDLDERRDAIRELIPELDEADRSGDIERWNVVADRAIAEWEPILSSYLTIIPIPALRDRVSAFYEEMLAGPHIEHGCVAPCSPRD